MNANHPSFLALRRLVTLGFAAFLMGCTSTPQHTNVLIFGTNTKVALDVSQDPVSGVGVTLGYKRQEAVWMPLMPNRAASAPASSTASGSAPLVPADCSPTLCPKFVGTDKDKQDDTYSVLASFGTKLSGGVDAQGKDARVKGEIAQYFATGLAARLLAQSGGAGLVNTNADGGLSAKDRREADQLRSTMNNELEELLIALADAGDARKINKTKLQAAFEKAPGKDIPDARKKRLMAADSMASLREVITEYSHDMVAKPMYDTLNAK